MLTHLHAAIYWSIITESVGFCITIADRLTKFLMLVRNIASDSRGREIADSMQKALAGDAMAK